MKEHQDIPVPKLCQDNSVYLGLAHWARGKPQEIRDQVAVVFRTLRIALRHPDRPGVRGVLARQLQHLAELTKRAA